MQSIPHNRITATDDDVEAVARIVRGGNWAAGQATGDLENAIAAACGRRHALAVASGSAALRLGLAALDIGAGDRVGVPAYSCVALPNAVLAVGGKPLALDCEAQSLNLEPRAAVAEAAFLRAIIAVSTFGLAADVRALARSGVPVIEDCSHGFGHGPLGRLAPLTVISLHATKFLGCGRGGAVLTDDEQLAQRLHALRDYDDKPMAPLRLNDMPDDLNAALALSRLARLGTVTAERARLAARYGEALAPLAAAGRIALPPSDPDRVWYRYAFATDDAQGWLARLEARGVQARSPVSSWLDDAQCTGCPAAASAFGKVVSIPLFPTLTAAEQDRVIDAVHAVATGS